MEKRYTVIIEKGKVAGVEVDGVRYSGAAVIRDEHDRATMESLLWGLPEHETNPAGMGKIPKIILGVFATVAAICLVIAIYSGIRTARAIAGDASATALVVELVTRPGSDGTPFSYPVVEFGLPDRSRVTVELPEGSYPPSYEIGQPVRVMYDPEDPRQVRVRSSIGPWIITLISGALGLAFVAASLFTLWVEKPAAPLQT